VTLCRFCSREASHSFDVLPMCPWHLTLLWLALRTEWTD
jgi:hypothetical protein